MISFARDADRAAMSGNHSVNHRKADARSRRTFRGEIRLETSWRVSSDMPMPVSRTVSRTNRAWRSVSMVSAPPFAMASNAFRIRFISALPSSEASPRTRGTERSDVTTDTEVPRACNSSIWTEARARLWSITALRSSGRNWRGDATPFEKSYRRLARIEPSCAA